MGLASRILDLIYPRVCGICDRAAEEGLCSSCAGEISWYEGPGCPLCGADRKGNRCRVCAGRAMEFRGAVALGRYEGKLREAVLALKFKGRGELADPLAARLAERVAEAQYPVDLVAFVPGRIFGHRLNPAEVLARAMARRLKAPVRAILRRKRRTRKQVDLPLKDRLVNPEGAYGARGRIDDAAVLLVDDVLTTGATAGACARALYERRARLVNLAVLARSE